MLLLAAVISIAFAANSDAKNDRSNNRSQHHHHTDKGQSSSKPLMFNSTLPEAQPLVVQFPSYELNRNTNANQRPEGLGGVPWDGWVAFFTAVLAGVSIWQGSVLIRDLDINKQALENAAAQHRLSNQAFAYVKNLDHTPELDRHGVRIGTRISLFWRNSGNTPTKDGIIRANWRLIEGDHLPADFDYSYPDDGEVTFIGPRAKVGCRPLVLTTEATTEAAAGRGTIYLWARIDYFDVFPGTARHFTRVCYRMTIEPRGMNDMIGFTPTGPHNDSDS